MEFNIEVNGRVLKCSNDEFITIKKHPIGDFEFPLTDEISNHINNGADIEINGYQCEVTDISNGIVKGFFYNKTKKI